MDATGAPELYREAAIETIRTEHRALSEVLALLRHVLGDIAAEHAPPDFPLLCTALYYIDDFACRCHHPKEEQYLFAKLRRYAPEAAATLHALGAEHQRDYVFVKDLHCLLVLYQAGAPAALKRLIDAVDVYTAMLHDHMRKEEALIDAHAKAIPAFEWQEIAAGFAREDDPMFGPAPQKEFAKLRARIMNMLPTKLRRHGQPVDEAC